MVQRFTTWPFAVTGTSYKRTQPARLADIRNVKDYGAVGDGTTNDTASIQSAIDTASVSGGAVFFPPGKYKIDTALTNTTVGTRIALIGSSANATWITSIAGSGYCIDQDVGFIDYIYGLTIEGAPSGGVRFTGIDGAIISLCVTTIDASGSNNVTIEGCKATGPSGYTAAHGSGACWYSGNNTTFLNCSADGWPIALQASGTGLLMIGCRTETNHVSLVLGKDRAGTVTLLTNFAILAHETERNDTAIEFYSAENGVILGSMFQGTLGVVGDQALNGCTWAGGIATVNTLVPHQMVGSGGVRLSGVDVAGYNNVWKVATVTGPSQFQFSLSDPGGPGTGGSWHSMQQRIFDFSSGTVKNVSILGIATNSEVQFAKFDMNSATSLENIMFQIIDPQPFTFSYGSEVTWDPPADAFKYSVTGLAATPSSLAVSEVFPFANLPTGVEGMEFNVNDAVVGGKTWGDSITAGSSTGNALLRYNGTNWTYEGA